MGLSFFSPWPHVVFERGTCAQDEHSPPKDTEQILRKHQDPCTVHVSESSTSFHRLFCVGCRYSQRLLSRQEHVSVGRVAGPWGLDTLEGGVLDTPESLGSPTVLQVLVGHLQEEWILLSVKIYKSQ